MYYLYKNPNIDKFADKVNIIYTITMIVSGILFPFVLMDSFRTADFNDKWSMMLSMLTIANTTLFLTMAWVKKWIKKIN